MWLLGTNYQNNLILAVSFFLMALFFIAILHGFQNLSGVQLSALHASPGFCGDLVRIPLEVTAPAGRGRHLMLSAFSSSVVTTFVPGGTSVTVHLPVQASHRGWLPLERIMVKSYYPLGLTRVWSWVHLEAKVLIYPQPKPVLLARQAGGEGEEAEGARLLADDDFMGFAAYQPGAPLSHIAWKLYARGGGLHLKQYGGAEQESLWLDYQRLTGGVEDRLSGLCYLALQWHKRGREFGLRLPGLCIAPAAGEVHLHQVLKALALFNMDDL